MTFIPLARAALGVEVPTMLTVFAVNRAVFLLLLWLGRWPRRRSAAR